MPRPRKPHWHEHSRRWRSVIDGRVCYFPKGIGHFDKPLIGGVPKAAWDHLAKLTSQPVTGHEGLTVTGLCELYLAWAEAEVLEDRMSDGHSKGLACKLGLLADHPGMGQQPARAITPDELHDFFASLKGKYSDHYIAGVGRAIRACWRWGVRPVRGRTPARLIGENPLAGFDFPRAPGAVRGYVEGAVVRRFYRWCWARGRGGGKLRGHFDRLFVLLMWFQRLTGCRPGEACGLLWDDIDWERARIVIPWQRTKTRQKVQRDGIIHLTPPVTRLLQAIERLPQRHPVYVFTHERKRNAKAVGDWGPWAGTPWPSGSAASQKVADLRAAAIEAKVAGIEATGPKKFVAYSHRHGYASDAVSLGMTHEQAAGLLRNTAGVLASVYAHAIEDDEAERARRVVERGKRRSGSK